MDASSLMESVLSAAVGRVLVGLGAVTEKLIVAVSVPPLPSDTV